MNMRPFQIVVLGIFIVLALVGVVLFASFKGFGNNSVKVGTVVIWGTLPADAIESPLTQFIQSNQSYKGVSYQQHVASTFDSDLANAIAAGTGPDMILITQEQLLTESNKLTIIPFSSISASTYHKTYLPIDDIFLTSSGTYGVPFLVDPLVMYYNRTSFQNAGITAPPSAWEAVTGLTPALTQISSGQIQKSLIAFGGYNNVENARAIISTLLFQTGNPVSALTSTGVQSELQAGGSSSFGSTPAQSAIDFYTQFANPAKTIYSWNQSLPSARQAFLSGDLALYFGFASERALLSAGNPNLNFDMAPVPEPATGSIRATYGLAYAFAIPKASHNASGALLAALALTSPSMVSGIASSYGMAPAQPALLTSSPNDLYQPTFYPQALIAKAWLSPSPSVTDAIFSTMISSITSGRQGVADAITTADQSLNAAVSQ